MLNRFHNRQQQTTNNNYNGEQSDPYVSFLLRQATQKWEDRLKNLKTMNVMGKQYTVRLSFTAQTVANINYL